MPHKTLQEANIRQVIHRAVTSTMGVGRPVPPVFNRVVDNVVKVMSESDLNHKLYALERDQGPMEELERTTLLESIAYLNDRVATVRRHFLDELRHRDNLPAAVISPGTTTRAIDRRWKGAKLQGKGDA